MSVQPATDPFGKDGDDKNKGKFSAELMVQMQTGGCAIKTGWYAVIIDGKRSNLRERMKNKKAKVQEKSLRMQNKDKRGAGKSGYHKR